MKSDIVLAISVIVIGILGCFGSVSFNDSKIVYTALGIIAAIAGVPAAVTYVRNKIQARRKHGDTES